jgi:hypothetical protein
MLRPTHFCLGLLLVFAVPAAFDHNDATAATKHKSRKASAPDQDPAAPSRASVKHRGSSAQKKSTASRPSSKKKPPEVKLKPVQPPAESPAPSATAAAAASPPPSRGPTRIDFDDRLIQGQTNKSGAVYLYDRKELRTPSMIKKRESFREEILATIYGN